MPKRALPSEGTPRKMPKRGSKSPGSAAVREVAADADDDSSSSALNVPAEPDAGLTNISDDEDMEVTQQAPSVTHPEVRTVDQLLSFEELRGTRQKFFDRFMTDMDKEGIDCRPYKLLLAELSEEDVGEQRTTVDQQLRDFVVERLKSQRKNWHRFLELSIHLAREQICSASQPIALISDFLELSSLQDCEEIFGFVEDRLHVWKEPLFLNSGKNSVLRMCNDLLRRLSRAQNTIFCGRILLFLSNYFPFSERSGLNIMSEFNAENVTTYKKGDGSDDPEDQMETTAIEESDEKLFEGIDLLIPGLQKMVSITQEEKKKKVKVDYNLYVKFWSLQDFFRNPTLCYNKVSWKSLSLYITDVLSAFTSFKLGNSNPHSMTSSSAAVANMDLHNRSHSSINSVPRLGDDDLYFPKYLTNRRLLELQMGDPNFRRHFLVQLLVILQYLTTSVKFKSEIQVLNEEQLDFVKKTNERIFSLLKEIKPGGKDFVKSVQHILKREDLWSKWKNDGCQPFKKPTASVGVESSDSSAADVTANSDIDDKEDIPAQPQKGKRHLGDILKDADSKNKFLLGNPELTRLWNICGDNLEACRKESRDFQPSVETFFAEAFKELDPEPTPTPVLIDPSKRKVVPKKNLSNANFGWRALRLLARNSPYFFQLVPSPPIQPLQNYLEYILKKIYADMDIPREDVQEEKGSVAPSGKQISQGVVASADGDQVMESQAETDELLKQPDGQDKDEDEEEGEVDEKVRNLTEDEQKAIGRLLGPEWKKVAAKLQFKNDEIQFFETDKGKDGAGAWMLKIWTEQEKEEATAADLLYQLEGLKLRELVREVFP